MSIPRALRVVLIALAVPTALAAQSIRGVVVDVGAVPVPGVVVQLLGTDQTVAARALTNERGEFLVATTRAGTYTVRTLRIGFKPVTSAPITLAAGEERSQRFELAGIPVSLASVRIDGGESVCGRATRDSSATAFTAWEQVRTALTATQITAGARAMTVTTITYERAFDPLGRTLLNEKADIGTAAVSTPWLERSADFLHTTGYVVDEGALGFTYHLPGLEMLGSATFLEDHCLRVDRNSGNQLIGIAFEPTEARRGTPEVRGTAWLDRTTSELRSVDFSYANLPDERSQLAGGTMEFARMTSGAWAIARWNLRMPVLEQVTRQGRLGGVMIKLAELRVTGAELTVARRGADTLWARAPLTLTGVVIDSVSDVPVAGAIATIVGTSKAATTNAQGRFAIPGVIPGEYKVDVRTPSLDSVKAVHQSQIAFIDSTTAHVLKVPNAELIRRVMTARNSALFTGLVLADSTKQPLRDVEISIPSLNKSVKTDSLGRFRIPDVTAGVHKVVARKVGLGAYEAPTYFLAAHVVQREIHLSRITELATVNVTAGRDVAGLPSSFEEHKTVGLGKFVTRDFIEKFDALGLQTTLSQITSVRIIPGRAGGGAHKAFISTSRVQRPGSLPCEAARRVYGANTYCGSPGNGCYAQVWLDSFLMNPESPTPPFDVNSISGGQVEAMEWYAGPSETPVKYSRMNSTCGVLVIHTRR